MSEGSIKDFGAFANTDDSSDEDISEVSGSEEEEYDENEEEEDDTPEYTYQPPENTVKPSIKFNTANSDNLKRDYLIKLRDLQSRGIKLTGIYDMDSDMNDIIMEYERHKKSAMRRNSLVFSKNILMFSIQGLEMMSNMDPFGLGIDLDGWSDSVNPDQFEDILEEIIEKYSGDSNTPPEIRLVFALVASASGVHLSNKLFGRKKKKQSRKISSLSSGSVKKPDVSYAKTVLNKVSPKRPTTSTQDVRVDDEDECSG
jgi:hypothetical protein